MEPFCVSLKRTLSDQHPLNQLLKYHCREILVPNTFGVPNLLGEGRLMDLLFACGNDGAYRMLRESYPLTSWEITDYRNNIKVSYQNTLTFLADVKGPLREQGLRRCESTKEKAGVEE